MHFNMKIKNLKNNNKLNIFGVLTVGWTKREICFHFSDQITILENKTTDSSIMKETIDCDPTLMTLNVHKIRLLV